MEDSSNLIPYGTVETAFLGARDYDREESDYYQLLTGKDESWDLTVLNNPEKAEGLGSFEQEDYQEQYLRIVIKKEVRLILMKKESAMVYSRMEKTRLQMQK